MTFEELMEKNPEKAEQVINEFLFYDVHGYEMPHIEFGEALKPFYEGMPKNYMVLGAPFLYETNCSRILMNTVGNLKELKAIDKEEWHYLNNSTTLYLTPFDWQELVECKDVSQFAFYTDGRKGDISDFTNGEVERLVALANKYWLAFLKDLKAQLEATVDYYTSREWAIEYLTDEYECVDND